MFIYSLEKQIIKEKVIDFSESRKAAMYKKTLKSLAGTPFSLLSEKQ